MKRLFSILSLFLIIFTFCSCSDISSGGSGEINTDIRDYCKTAEEAYNEGKTGNMLEKEKAIKNSIDEIKVNNEVTLWIAEKESDTLMIAPMLTQNKFYYFTGKETNYYIPDITGECDDTDYWAKYILKDKSVLKVTVFKGKGTHKDAEKTCYIKIGNTDYTLVYRIEK